PITTNVLYAGCQFGVFKSTDSGNSWSASNAGLPDQPTIVALLIDPTVTSTLYAGSLPAFPGAGGIFKSTDGGANWNDTGVPRTTFVDTLAIHPMIPSTIYAGLGAGIFSVPGTVLQDFGALVSTNSGNTWSPLNSGFPDKTSVRALAIDSTASTLYAGTD